MYHSEAFQFVFSECSFDYFIVIFLVVREPSVYLMCVCNYVI